MFDVGKCMCGSDATLHAFFDIFHQDQEDFVQYSLKVFVCFDVDLLIIISSCRRY